MLVSAFTSWLPEVALRKESVDRNDGKLDAELWVMCRSPQGERG